ncbi:Protein F38A1.8 [Aphelenchoides avenae]|nr:Protein F38A1.8 [Aphelenchus avenae]
MIELFTIFGKGGLVLWCFNEGSGYFKEAVNALVQNVILQGRNVSSFNHEGMTLKYKMDNEFDIVVLVVYQSVIQLAYADKLLSEVHIRFRDMYKNVLQDGSLFLEGPKLFNGFNGQFSRILAEVQQSITTEEPKKPRTFQESEKSKKTVASMVETAADRAAAKAKAEKEDAAGKKKDKKASQTTTGANKQDVKTSPESTPASSPKYLRDQDEEDEEVLRRREALFKKKGGKPAAKKEPKESAEPSKKGKQARVWGLGGGKQDGAVLDYSSPPPANGNGDEANGDERESEVYQQNKDFVGKYKGELPGLDEGSDGELEEDIEDDNDESVPQAKGGGWLSTFKSLVSNKQLTRTDIEPVLEKMKENLINKNVAAEPAEKICESVGAKLEGKVVGTFNRVQTIVREAMREALVQLLTPKRRVDILRDVVQAKADGRPYIIVFCGVNGVGKSTNLAKITFWLNENGHRVLIAAGDTFRAGAVEQLRTHTRHLNALHPQGVQLYEQGYDKNPAELAKAAVKIAMDRQIDVVLVDTAGRMQDNEPLMRALSTLIQASKPDLVLFVGEALVGNEAVDQLVKFNQALANHSATNDKQPRLIDGIVGAAVSMTYITGQPIVFVGTGQTYKDLKNLNANAVVNSLLK